jgi:hypothetical protein
MIYRLFSGINFLCGTHIVRTIWKNRGRVLMTYLKELEKQYMKSTGWPFNQVPSYYWKRDSAVGIATGYGLDDEGVRV